MRPRYFLSLTFLVMACSAFANTNYDPVKHLQFNLETTVGEYEKFGRKNAKWNNAATNSLHAFAKLRVGEGNPDTIKTVAESSKVAIELGCDDPLVKYLFLRYNRMEPAKADEKTALEYKENAAALQNSKYHPLRKFYAELRTSQALKSADEKKYWPQIVELWHSAGHTLSNALLSAALPLKEVEDGCTEFLLVTYRSEKHFKWSWDTVEKPLFDNWAKTAAPYVLKGWFYNKYAWWARGSSYSDKVAEDKWPLFYERLKLAEEALESGWKVDTTDYRIPYNRMTTERGQGKGRKVMELWFGRAIALNTNNYEICESKLVYLEPKWFGSAQDMLKFGRECVQRDEWGGSIPLILPEAHSKLAKYIKDEKKTAEYWESEEVWADIHSAFKRFFDRNPKENGYRHNYVRYSYLCKQWDVLNEEIPKLGEINYTYFGGKDKFDEMKRLANQNVKR